VESPEKEACENPVTGQSISTGNRCTSPLMRRRCSTSTHTAFGTSRRCVRLRCFTLCRDRRCRSSIAARAFLLYRHSPTFLFLPPLQLSYCVLRADERNIVGLDMDSIGMQKDVFDRTLARIESHQMDTGRQVVTNYRITGVTKHCLCCGSELQDLTSASQTQTWRRVTLEVCSSSRTSE
jgi:hypothetical protein